MPTMNTCLPKDEPSEIVHRKNPNDCTTSTRHLTTDVQTTTSQNSWVKLIAKSDSQNIFNQIICTGYIFDKVDNETPFYDNVPDSVNKISYSECTYSDCFKLQDNNSWYWTFYMNHKLSLHIRKIKQHNCVLFSQIKVSNNLIGSFAIVSCLICPMLHS